MKPISMATFSLVAVVSTILFGIAQSAPSNVTTELPLKNSSLSQLNVTTSPAPLNLTEEVFEKEESKLDDIDALPDVEAKSPFKPISNQRKSRTFGKDKKGDSGYNYPPPYPYPPPYYGGGCPFYG